MPRAAASKNKRKSKVKVGAAAHGRGVYAQVALAEDVVVGRVRGEVTDDLYEDPDYSMDVGCDMVLIPKAPFRYLNHSCEPNCELFSWEEDYERDEPRPLHVGTLRAIAVGEELTIDYAWPADSAIECGCGSESCRGWIVDQSELAKLLRRHARRAKSRSKAGAKKTEKAGKAKAERPRRPARSQ